MAPTLFVRIGADLSDLTSAMSGAGSLMASLGQKAQALGAQLTQALGSSSTQASQQMSSSMAAAARSTVELQNQLKAVQQRIQDLQAADAAMGGRLSSSLMFAEQMKSAQDEAESLQGQLATLGAEEVNTANQANNAGQAHQNLASQLTAIGTAATRVGMVMSAAVTAPIVGAATAAIKFGADFETNMTRVQTLAGASSQEVETMRQKILDLAPAVGIGPNELAKGLFSIESEGYRGAQALDILTLSAKATAMGLGDSYTVTRTLVTTMKAFQQQGLSAADAMDIIIATVQQGDMPIDSLASALGRVNAIAAAAGIPFAQVGAAIATFTRAGVSSAEAVTGLRAVIQALEAPTKQTTKALADLGMTTDDMRRMIADQGLAGAMLTLMDRTHGNIDQLRQLIPNVRGLTEALATAKSQAGDYVTILGNIEHSHGDLAAGFQATSQTLQFQWGQVKAQAEAVAVQLGDQLIPIIKEMVPDIKEAATVVQGWVQAWGQLPESTKEVTVVLLALLAAAGPVLLVLGQIASAAGALAGAFGIGETSLAATAAAATGAEATGVVGLAGALGSLGTVLAVIAAAIAGFKLGSWIDQVTGADKAVTKWADDTFQLTNALKIMEGAAAQQNKDIAAAHAAAGYTGPGSDTNFSAFSMLNGPGGELAAGATPLMSAAAALDGITKSAGDAYRSLGQVGDGADKAGKAAKKAADQLQNLRNSLSGADATNTAYEYIEALHGLGPVSSLTVAAQKRIGKAMEDAAAVFTAAGKSIPEDIFAIAKEVGVDFVPAIKTIDGLSASLLQVGQVSKSVYQSLPTNPTDTLATTGFSWQSMGKAHPDSFQQVFPGQALDLAKTLTLPDNTRDSFVQMLFGNPTQFGESLSKTIESAVQGGGNVLESVGSDIGASFGKSIAKEAGGSITGFFSSTFGGKIGKALGGAFAGALPVIGSLIGPALSGIGAIFNHFFGTAGRDAVTQFASTFAGGFSGLQQQLAALPNGQQLWTQLTQGVGRNDAAGAQTAINNITTALNTLHSTWDSQASDIASKISALGGSIPKALDPYIQKLQQAGILTAQNAQQLQALEGDGKPSLDTLTQLQSKYNLTAGQMGAAFQTQQIDANFQTIIDDMDTLTRGGADVTAAMFTIGSDGSKSLSGLGTAIQGDIQAAINAGVAIPDNLKDAAAALVAQGALIDTTGKKITDVSKLTFGETMQTSLDNLNKTLLTLIATMTGTDANSLTSAMTAASKSAQDSADNMNKAFGSVRIPNFGSKVLISADLTTDNSGTDTTGLNVPHMAAGAYITRPTYALVGEAGPEIVAPESKLREIVGAGAGPNTITVVSVLDGREVARNQYQYLAHRVRQNLGI